MYNIQIVHVKTTYELKGENVYLSEDIPMCFCDFEEMHDKYYHKALAGLGDLDSQVRQKVESIIIRFDYRDQLITMKRYRKHMTADVGVITEVYKEVPINKRFE